MDILYHKTIYILLIICIFLISFSFYSETCLSAMDKKISFEINKIEQSNIESIHSNSAKIIEKIYKFLNQNYISTYDVDYLFTITEENDFFKGAYNEIKKIFFSAFQNNNIELKNINTNSKLWGVIGANLKNNRTYYKENFNHDYENNIIVYILVNLQKLKNYSIISDISDMHCTDLIISPVIYFLKKIPQENLIYQYHQKIAVKDAIFTYKNKDYIQKSYTLNKIKIKEISQMIIPLVNCDSEFVNELIQEKYIVEKKILLFCAVDKEIRLYLPDQKLPISRDLKDYKNKEIEVYVILED